MLARKIANQHASIRKQITTSLRTKLESGELKPGDRLPSTLELAKIWGTQEPTIQRALSPLVKEGYIERTPRLGTFVSKRGQKVLRLGIYAPSSLWKHEKNLFSRAVIYELQKQLEARKIEAMLFIDPRSDANQSGAWDALLDSTVIERLDALIVPSTDIGHMQWIDKVPLPVVYLTSGKIPNRVSFDDKNMTLGVLELLRRQGCKSAGLISIVSAIQNPGGIVDDGYCFSQKWAENCRKYGIENRPEWNIFWNDLVYGQIYDHPLETFGYNAMNQLLSMEEKPDGIFVYTDFAARGAIMAAMSYGAGLSTRIKLVLHRNAQIGLFCPMPAAFVEINIEKVAAALIDQAFAIRSGKRIKEKLVAYNLIPAP